MEGMVWVRCISWVKKSVQVRDVEDWDLLGISIYSQKIDI